METNEVNPYQGEQISLPDEIKAELERLEAKKQSLLELLEYYE